MFGSTILCYLDRQAITFVKPQITAEFHLTNAGFGWILAAFSLTYAFSQIPAGLVVDRYDVRFVYAFAVGWWSLAAMLMSFAPTLGVLMVFRGLLGVGESFNWPCALRATSSVLPASERGLGNGIFNSGAAVGAVVGPLFVPRLSVAVGWRPTFVLVGSLGLAWVVGWLWMVRGTSGDLLKCVNRVPDRPNSRVTRERRQSSNTLRCALGMVLLVSLFFAASFFRFGEQAIWWSIASSMLGILLVCRILPLESLRVWEWTESLGEVVRFRRFWILAIVSISINVGWHFLVNWLPTYFKDDRRMSYLASGYWSALPFLAADMGNLGGGGLSRWLAGRGMSPASARLRVVAICSFLICPGALLGRIENDALAIVLLIMMALGMAAYMANYFAYCQEVSPSQTGIVVGALGGLGNLFVGGFLPLAGSMKDSSGSFGAAFMIVGCLPLVGLVALAWGWGVDDKAEV